MHVSVDIIIDMYACKNFKSQMNQERNKTFIICRKVNGALQRFSWFKVALHHDGA